MLSLNLVNQSDRRLPRAFLTAWVQRVEAELKRRKVKVPARAELTIVFLNPTPARKLNREYRGRDYATDVLSFQNEDPLGDLVLCPQVLERQAREHELSFRDELGYMIIHGILHLLGFDHEENQKDARVMYALQDAIFETLRTQAGR